MIRFGYQGPGNIYLISSAAYDGSAPQNAVIVNNASALAWHHVVVVYDDFVNRMYYDGVLIDTDNTILDAFACSDDLFVGRRGSVTNRFFHGDIDDIGIWNRALTQCEISELYHAQQFTPPVLALSDTTSTCGASTTLDAGTDPAWASYLWNTTEITQTIAVSDPGLYTVEVTDTNGCVGYDTTLVSIIDPTIDQVDTNICIGDSLVLSVGENYTNCIEMSANLKSGLLGYWP